MTTKLLPCPFCGHTEIDPVSVSCDPQCRNCGASCGIWNKRAGLTDLQREAMRVAAEFIDRHGAADPMAIGAGLVLVEMAK